MEINIKCSYGSIDVIIEAENVKIDERISESIYALKEDGRKDFNSRIGEDVTDAYMDKFIRLTNEIAYYRKKDYDSTDLIETLFDKMPQEKAELLFKSLNDKYEFLPDVSAEPETRTTTA